MLETYMNEVQNYESLNVETVDAQTNTDFRGKKYLISSFLIIFTKNFIP